MIKITNPKLFKTGRWRSIPKLVRIMKTKCLDLRNLDLRYSDLSFANLTGANLNGADLTGADLRYADLSYADLECADLSYADLFGANLAGANVNMAHVKHISKSRFPVYCLLIALVFSAITLCIIEFKADRYSSDIDNSTFRPNSTKSVADSINKQTLRKDKDININMHDNSKLYIIDNSKDIKVIKVINKEKGSR